MSLGAHWVKVRPKNLVRFFGVDYIFLYQFGVYLALWLWATVNLIRHGYLTYSGLYVFAFPLVVAGYLIPRRWGVMMCAAGDAAMSWTTAQLAWVIYVKGVSGFAVVLAIAIALCMAVRFIRDAAIFFSPRSTPEDP